MSHDPYSETVPDLQVEQDPTAAFLTRCYGNALDRLSLSFEDERPLAILIGEGRSATNFVIRTFLSSLDESVAVAHITEPCADATDLMREIVRAAGFAPKDMGLRDLESIFRMLLAVQKGHDRRTVVCIEELQNSEWWVLDKIRSIVEVEVEGEYGMMLIISGEPSLKELLNTRTLSSISAWAGYRISVPPFTLAETTECIRHRIEAGGSTTIGQVFQYQAISLIHELCSGVLGAINALVDQCLKLANLEGVSLVTNELVMRAYETGRATSASPDPDAATIEVNEIELPMGRLLVQLTGEDIRDQALHQGHTLIGRSMLCDIRIDSSIVSRHHALINYSPDGATLVDLGSTNGTYVDGYQINQHELVPGETITVGNCRIEYVVDDERQASFQKSLGLTPRLRRE